MKPSSQKMIEVHCHNCDRCLGEVGELSTGPLKKRCHKCGHWNYYDMPNVDPRQGRRLVREEAAAHKKTVAPPA